MALVTPLGTQWNLVKSLEIRPSIPQGYWLHYCTFSLKMVPGVRETTDLWVFLSSIMDLQQYLKYLSLRLPGWARPVARLSILNVGYLVSFLTLSRFPGDLSRWLRLLFAALVCIAHGFVSFKAPESCIVFLSIRKEVWVPRTTRYIINIFNHITQSTWDYREN